MLKAKLLEVRHLSKTFTIHQLGREVEVLNEVSFNLQPATFTLITGANGTGKSTLLRCLYRTYLPTTGAMLFDSSLDTIDLATASEQTILHVRRHDMGYVSQFLRPRPRVSALGLVAEPLVYAGSSRQEALEQAAAQLSAYGLKEALWQAYPTTFSGGEQQKVNLARALIRPCRLLLLDEPTASLDAETRTALVRQLADLKRHGVAMLGVFHHPEDVTELIDDELELQVFIPSSSRSKNNELTDVA
jgi:alpha-D-ribose 1-methylphosphonate 5-triphosphate synthase subunit PhnL